MTDADQMEMLRDVIEQALHDIYEDYGERGNPIWHSDRIAYAVMNAIASVARAEACWEVPVNPDGWTDWVHPLPNYRMQCCDCGLVHVSAEFPEAKPGDSGRQFWNFTHWTLQP
jgi:hypothetical protein